MKRFPTLGALTLAMMAAACAPAAGPAPATPAPAASEVAPTASLAEAGEYELQFERVGDELLPALTRLHRLKVATVDGETTVELAGDEVLLNGTADASSDGGWMVGLAGFANSTGQPVVMHMTVLPSGEELTGSAVVDSDGRSYAASFVAKKATSSAPDRVGNVRLGLVEGPLSPAPAATPRQEPEGSHYHLPDGIR